MSGRRSRKAVTDVLDKWDSQLSASEFKSLVHKFLTLLTDHSPVSDPSPNSSLSSPRPVVQPDVRNASPPISTCIINQEDARRKELSKWPATRIRTLLQKKRGSAAAQFICKKADLVEEVIDLEFANESHSDEGDNSEEEEDSESEDNQEDVRRAQLHKSKLSGPGGVAEQATKLGVFKPRTKKADLIEAILEKLKERNSEPSPSPMASPSAALPARIDTAPILGFRVGIITPYMHASGAHLWEQRLHLAKLGKFIGHPLTHKHISCSPSELSNNTYNRTYFQTSSRRLDGLEKTILLTSWRAILNTVDLDRNQHICPHCSHKTVRAEWMRRHITAVHPHASPINQ